MKLGVRVGLGPGHIVLDGDPATPPPKRHSPKYSAHVCCGQTAGWIKMPLGTEVGLGPGDFLLDADLPSPKGGRVLPNFGPMSSWPNGWMDQEATWHGGRPRPRQHCIRWRPRSPPQTEAQPPIFGPCLLGPVATQARVTTVGGSLRHLKYTPTV